MNDKDKGQAAINTLDPEWVKLIINAKQLGFSVEQIKKYLKEKSLVNKQTTKTNITKNCRI